jgi:excisionase family DNA binding protein
MQNPFEEISDRLKNIESLLTQTQHLNKTNGDVAKEKFLTINEAALFLGLAKQSLYQLVSKKKIPVMKQGKLFFRRDDLITWVESGKKLTISEIAETSRPTLIKRSTSKTNLQ